MKSLYSLFAAHPPALAQPDRGFTLSFTDATVIIEGTGLAPLFRSITEHRTAEIVEAVRAQTLIISENSECLVTRILVSPSLKSTDR